MSARFTLLAEVKRYFMSVGSWPNAEAWVALFSVSYIGENRRSNSISQARFTALFRNS